MRILSVLSLPLLAGCAAVADGLNATTRLLTTGSLAEAADAGAVGDPSLLVGLMSTLGLPGGVAASAAALIGTLFAVPATRPRMMSASKHLGSAVKDLTIDMVAGVAKDGGAMGKKAPK